jgi:hypothetical protein
VPLILTANESSEHERHYGNVLDVEYEYPAQYRKRIEAGEQFIYYRGTSSSEPGYFATGIIGAIRPSRTAGRIVCEVVDVSFFDEPVPLKDKVTGEYFEEVGPNRVSMRQGVRRIEAWRAAQILRLADEQVRDVKGTSGFAWDQAHQEAVFRYSTDVVLDLLRHQKPLAVTELPKNNPGFDILVDGGSHTYVEVKGTSSPDIGFFVSEGERAFSVAHASEYATYVVFDIDLIARTHQVALFPGSIPPPGLSLEPIQYRVH